MTLEPEQLGRSKADLAATLRDLRKRAGLTGDRLGKRCAMSQSKISKIETGRTTASLVDVERILRAVEAPPELAGEVMALARLAHTEWQDKRSSWRRGLEKRQAELAALESESTEMRYFLPSMLTALLATPEYAKASLAHSPGDTSKTVSRKLERQAVLYDTSKRFTFLLTEQAVRWLIVPASAMTVQIDRLTSLSRLPNIRMGILLDGVTIPRGPLNPFTVYDDRLATAETFTGRIVFQDVRDVTQYREVFDMYAGFAVYEDEARNYLAARARSLLRDL
ncbi:MULTISPECIES: helix-turn-helix domain-containing protein [unclassified Streptomyces]|uniref:helix-turn-helix domain-containing protein n=1 Tax=unclassified Streptomyces TaxID=2593676 RepID=UPI0037FE5B3A